MKLVKSMLVASVLSVAAPVLAAEMTIVSWGGAYSKSQLKAIMSLIPQKLASISSMMTALQKRLQS